VTFYRLRHSFKTLGKNARDRESLDLMMGHRDAFVGRINEKLDSLNPAVTNLLGQGQTFFLQHTGDPHLSRLMTLQSLENLRNQQASSLAYFDIFWSSAAASVLLMLLMRRSVAEKGTHIAAE